MILTLPEKLKFGFIITSAINTKFGVFSSSERMQQTLHTIASIKSHCPNAKIFLLEMAGESLSEEQQKLLQSYVEIIDFTESGSVQEIYQSPNWDLVKNATEMLCFRHGLASLAKHDLTNNIDRFFKVSGRYLLNENFQISRYLTPEVKGKIVFGKARPSQFSSVVTDGNTTQYMSRCWSFDAALIEEIEQCYEKMLAFMMDRVNAGGYIDIEHCLYKFLDPQKIIEDEVIGIQGLLGPNGVLIND